MTTTHTIGQKEWLKRRQNVKDGKPNAIAYFKNVAVTLAGDLVVGLSYHRELERYSCSAIEFDGIRYNHPKRWNKQGIALDVDLSDLNLASVHTDVNTI